MASTETHQADPIPVQGITRGVSPADRGPPITVRVAAGRDEAGSSLDPVQRVHDSLCWLVVLNGPGVEKRWGGHQFDRRVHSPGQSSSLPIVGREGPAPVNRHREHRRFIIVDLLSQLCERDLLAWPQIDGAQVPTVGVALYTEPSQIVLPMVARVAFWVS